MSTKKATIGTVILGTYISFIGIAIIIGIIATAFYFGGFDAFEPLKNLRTDLVENNLHLFSSIIMIIDIATVIPLAITVICMHNIKAKKLDGNQKQTEQNEEKIKILERELDAVNYNNSMLEKEKIRMAKIKNEIEISCDYLDFEINSCKLYSNEMKESLDNIVFGSKIGKRKEINALYKRYRKKVKKTNESIKEFTNL